jgi:hypothetical protein
MIGCPQRSEALHGLRATRSARRGGCINPPTTRSIRLPRSDAAGGWLVVLCCAVLPLQPSRGSLVRSLRRVRRSI